MIFRALCSVIGLEICVMGCAVQCSAVQLGWILCDGMGCVMKLCEIELCLGLEFCVYMLICVHGSVVTS